ncbi:hypothetical protein F4781DRAFT_433358 [Annulohypoxylon bovei var. microspora]|nr:hypothetical protein F4781DRAFT_433358 [Annulohypoxylon bovei var. microspora]
MAPQHCTMPAGLVNGGAPTSQPPTPAFGESPLGSLFSPTTAQARPHTSLFGAISPQDNRTPMGPFGTAKAPPPQQQPSPTHGFHFGNPNQPRGLVIGSPAPVQPGPSSPSLFGPRPTAPVASPVPAVRTSQVQARSTRTSPNRASPERTSPERVSPQRASSMRGSQTPTSSSSQSPAKSSPSSVFGSTRAPSPGSRTSMEQEATPRPPKCYVDAKGDLCLEVGHLSAEFIVCSKAMSRSSPFWKKMLYGGFAEGKNAQPKDGKSAWVVKLPEDNSAAMGIILNIIHSRFDQVSGYEDFVYTTHLYNLCVLTDKYDMTHILRPWAKGWSRSTHIQCEKLGQSLRSKFCHERLWIAWELGDFVTFDAMSKALLLNSSSSAGNNLRYVGALEPPEIYESIQRARLAMIKALLSRLDAILQGLVQQNKSLCSRYKVSSERGECLASMLGTTIQSLHGNGLWPIPQPTAVECSVWDFAAKLQAVQIEGDAGIYHKCSQTVVLKAEIEKTLYSIPELLSEVHWRHLQSQASKSGMPTFELRAH